jgi:protocatechuate 3,4-dioxygenase beta subunit
MRMAPRDGTSKLPEIPHGRLHVRRFVTLVVAGLALGGTLLCRSALPQGEQAPQWVGTQTDAQRVSPVSRAFAPVAVVSAFSGTVRNMAGEPIAGANVCAACASCESTNMPIARCVQTNDKGQYALDAKAQRAVVISAVAAGYTLGYAAEGLPLPSQADPRAQLDIVLASGGVTLRGVVVDALGGPVPDARVLLEQVGDSSRSVQETRTDEAGQFSMATSPGYQTLRAEQIGYAPRSKGLVAPAYDVELQLAPASTLRGRVVAEGTDRPVSGVAVRARPEGFPALGAPAISADDGTFTLDGLEPGRYLIAAESEVWRGRANAWVDVRLAEQLEGLLVPVAPAVRVLGHVEQLEGGSTKPCPRGIVTLDPAGALDEQGRERFAGVGQGSTAPIESDGLVRFGGIPAGRYEVAVQCPGHVLSQGPTSLDVEEQELEVKWKVRRGLALNVDVVDSAGQPVPDLPLFLVSERDARPGVEMATAITTDRNGRAAVRDELTPGTYTLRPAQGAEGESSKVRLREGDAPTQLTLRLPGSGAIWVAVRDEGGRPVDDLHISAVPISTERDPLASAAPLAPQEAGFAREVLAIAQGAGQYRIGPLRPGAYAVRSEDGVGPSLALGDRPRVQVRAGLAAPLTLTLPRGGRIRGTVVDDHGDPEAHVWVSAGADGEEPSAMARQLFLRDPPARVLTDADGRFELSRLRPGASYTLKAKQPYDNAVALHGVAEGQTVRIVLPPSASISGFVADSQGGPLAHVHVSAFHEETNTTRTALARSDGSFTVERIPAGRVLLQAGDLGHGFAQREVSLAPGQRLVGQTVAVVARPTPTETAAAPASAAGVAPAGAETEQQGRQAPGG